MDIVLVPILFVYGCAVGSFLNVLVDRLSNDEGIGGRSHCEHCNHKLSWRDLIPLFSYISLGGKCRYCHKKLTLQYPAAELIGGILFVAAWYMCPYDGIVMHLLSVAVVSILAVIVGADLKYHIIPDEMQIALVIVATAINIIVLHSVGPVLLRLIEGIFVMAPILFLHVITKGRGMGFGDVKFAYVMGYMLGAFNGFIALYIAFVVGAIVGVLILASRRGGMKQKIAFGPFLILGTVLMFFYSTQTVFLVDKFILNR